MDIVMRETARYFCTTGKAGNNGAFKGQTEGPRLSAVLCPNTLELGWWGLLE